MRATVALLTAATTAVVVVASAPSIAPAGAAPSAVTEVNPNAVTSGTLFGGRGQHLSVDPINSNVVYEASELGGVWKSTDAGGHWSHIDAVPLSASNDIQVAGSDSSLVVAAGGYDGRTQSGGGVWRSTDGGQTWAKPATSDPTCTNEPSANRIAIAPGTPGQLSVFAADSCGISRSTDSGATWTHADPSGNNFTNDQFYDVQTRVVSNQIQVDACGNNGYYRSTDGGATYTGGTAATQLWNGNTNSLIAPCTVATAPQDANTVFFAALKSATSFCSSAMMESDDGGQTWNSIAPSSLDSNCRPAWTKTHVSTDGNPNHFEIWFGDNSRTFHQTCDATATPRCSSGAWSYYDDSVRALHKNPDSSDLAFGTDDCPFLETGDGGVFKTADGCNSSPTFAASNLGMHALQIAAMAGAVATSPAHTDLYFGTQDNGIWASTNGGTDWRETGPDVYTVLSDPTAPGNHVLWRDCCSLPGPPLNSFHYSNEDFSSTGSFSSPPGTNVPDSFLADQAQFASNFFVFATNDGASTPTWKIYVSKDAGSTWNQMGGNVPGQPGELKVSGSSSSPVIYLQSKVGNAQKLYRLLGPISTAATFTEIDTGLTTPSFFSVHPTDPNRLYVVDGGAGQIFSSHNGGASWQAEAALTSMATQNGAFKFSSGIGPQVSAITFDRSSNTVMLGTQTAGILASADGGAHWMRVNGGEQVTRVVDFFFDDSNGGIYVGSAGRGMWKLALPSADLSITKTASPEPVTAGRQLTYTITVHNDAASASTAQQVTVTDDLPSDVTYLTSSIPCTEAPPGHLTCSLPDLAPNQTTTFTITTLVHSNTVLGTGGAKTIINTASVSSGLAIDTNPANNTATATSTVVDSADLAVSKLCKPDTTVYAGTPIDCTVFVDNHGPSDARNVTLDDVMLSNGTFTVSNVATDPSGGTCAVTTVSGGQKLSCALGSLAAASSTEPGRVTVSYRISATDGQDLDNEATVRSDTPDPDSSNNKAVVNLTITSVADLALTKTGPASATAGVANGLTWTLSVTNNGPSIAKNVVVSDNVPAGVTISSVSMPGASCTAGVPGDATHPTVCTFGSLAAGATSSTMTIVATVNPSTTGTLHNDARVSSATFDNNSSNDLAHSDTNVVVQADVSIVKSTPNAAIAGQPLTYKLTVTNNGPSTATGITISDPLDANLVFVSTSGTGTCGLQSTTNTVSCQLPDLAPGQSVVTFINTTVKASTPPGSISNTATVSSNNDPNAANNSSTVTTTISTSADLAIAITSEASVYKPSSNIHYQITVTNAGPSDASHVVIVVNLPSVKQASYISNDLGCPPPSGTTLTCSWQQVAKLVTIPAGGSISFQVNEHITGNKGTITTSTTVTSATSDPNTANNSATRNVTVHN